jgi:hypothetical protein
MRVIHPMRSAAIGVLEAATLPRHAFSPCVVSLKSAPTPNSRRGILPMQPYPTARTAVPHLIHRRRLLSSSGVKLKRWGFSEARSTAVSSSLSCNQKLVHINST